MLHKKFQSNHSDGDSISRSIVKIGFVAGTVLAVFFGLSSVGGTLSYYSDIEFSLANTFKAGTVDVDGSTTGDEAGRVGSYEDGVVSVRSETFEIEIYTDGSTLSVVYQAHAELAEGNPLGCEDIQLEASFGEYVYSGPILNFLSTSTSSDGWWTFTVTVPENSTLLPDALCAGEIVFEARIHGAEASVEDVFTDEAEYYFKLQSASAPAEPLQTVDVPPETVSPALEAETPAEGEVQGEATEEPLPKPEEIGTIEALDVNANAMIEDNMDAEVRSEGEDTTEQPPKETPPEGQ